MVAVWILFVPAAFVHSRNLLVTISSGRLVLCTEIPDVDKNGDVADLIGFAILGSRITHNEINSVSLDSWVQ